MWDSLFNLLIKSSSQQPKYQKDHCIAFKQSMSVCHVCKDVCPHEAISFQRGKEIVIDAIDCSGCGLCVQACPSQALEAKLNYQAGAPVKCSQVKGGAQTIQCLGQLAPSDLLRLAAQKNTVSLVRNECKTCKIGTEAILEHLEQSIEKAQTLAKLKNRDLEVQVQVLDKYDATDNPERISRRDLFKGSWRSLQSSAAEALAPLDPGGNDELSLPKEMQRQYRMIASSQLEAETLVPWELPRVSDSCILCPICSKICPTQAFSRNFNVTDKGTVLMLEPDKCNGCNACVKACPVKVISMDDQVTWEELSGGKKELFFKKPKQASSDSGGNVSR